MNIIDWFKSVFTKSKPTEVPTDTTPFIMVEPPTVFDSFQSNSEIVNEVVVFPHWLSNEEALKDEGVIFGLSEAKPDEKIKIIESIFNQKATFLEKKREELSEKIGEINLYLEKNHTELEEIEKESLEIKLKEFSDENIVRVIVGLIISLGMCIGNYYLIDFSISQGFPVNHQWISWGVFLAGMFSLFNPTSVFHLPDAKLTWKNTLEEFGVPFAASLFVFAQVVSVQPVFKSIALFIFIFFLFTFSGKILLSSISRLKQELNILNKNKNLRNDKLKIKTDWKIEAEAIEQKMEQLRIEKWKILPSLNQTEAELLKINNEKEALINIFISEFNLAKSYKSKLNASQIKNIIG
jgi:hypothetical protein